MSDNQTRRFVPGTKIAVFPMAEVRSRFRTALERVHDDLSHMREPWELDLDSLAIIDVVLVVKDLFDFAIAPERVVRKGGYRTVDEAVDDMAERLQRQWAQRRS
jgi:acyl carrier protein